ncbi:MAG: VCBS repeat-containing protein [Phycisphaerae bacterium]
MRTRIVKPIGCAVLCGMFTLGCAMFIGGGGDDTTVAIMPVEGGFVDLGSFFTVGEGAGTIVPFEPQAEDEVATDSFFAARSIDPFSEDSAGPKFVAWGDIDRDGFPDLASVWNQSQVIQLQLQRRDDQDRVLFQSVQIDGTSPLAIMAGIELADIDQDGRLDIVLLVKHNGGLAICPGNGTEQPASFVGEIVILFAPAGDVTVGGDWEQVRLVASLFGRNKLPDRQVIEERLRECVEDARTACVDAVLPGCGGDTICAGELCDDVECEEEISILALIDDNFPGIPFGDGRAMDIPENGGMNALAVGDINGDGLPDILITANVAKDPCHNGINEVELYPNPGAAAARDGEVWNQIILDRNAPLLKDIVLNDIDGDGDLDVYVTRVDAITRNISWLENPSETGVIDDRVWTRHPVGQVDGGTDVMAVGDVDGDGFDDIVLRSNGGRVIQWFRHPSPDDELNVTDVFADIPWAVYTLFELADQLPLGIALGDINFDGQLELLLAAEGSVFWIDSSTAPTVFDEWSSNLIVDDAQLETSLFAAAGPAFINDVLVLDLDCDGANDIIATVDRRSLSGLSTDVIIWFRNVLLPEDVGLDAPLVPGCP